MFQQLSGINITDCVIQSSPSGGLRLVADKKKKKIKKNKQRVKHEPRSAHGRAVKKPKAEQETAQPTAARFNKRRVYTIV